MATGKVLNKHKVGIPAGVQYIGRGSIYGNSYVIGQHGDRDMVCDLFDWDLAGDERRLKELDNLVNKDVVCFCSPARCHGDTLVRLAAMSFEQRLAWAAKIRLGPAPVARGTASLFEDNVSTPAARTRRPSF